MTSIGERRIDAWTTLAGEPAVRAAERAITTGSTTVLADTLSIAAAAEARRRLADVLELKERAERDPAHREAYQRAAEDLRSWAAGVYLAVVRGSRPEPRTPVVRHENPYTEESASIRRHAPRPPFPGQPRRHPYFSGPANPRVGSRRASDGGSARWRSRRRAGTLETTGNTREE